jgi:hypothetical protein
MGHKDILESRKCAQQGGDPNQFGILEFDFESNSKSRITLPSN